MREMSSEMATLLKSKKMVGENRPTHRVFIDGMGGGIPDNIQWDTPLDYFYQIENNQTMSNWIEASNGKAFSVYVDLSNNHVMGAYTIGDKHIEQHYPIESVFDTGVIMQNLSDITQPVVLYKRDDGKILLFTKDGFTEPNTGVTLNCYISNNGLGTDFILLKTIYAPKRTDATSADLITEGLNIPIKTKTGRLVLTFGGVIPYPWSPDFDRSYMVFVSDDEGANWVRKWYWDSVYSALHVYQPVCISDGTIYFEGMYGHGVQLYYSIDDGETWSAIGWMDDFAGNTGETAGGSLWYNELNDTIYRIVSFGQNDTTGIYRIKNPTHQKVINKLEWERVVSTKSTTHSPQRIQKTISGKWAISAPAFTPNEEVTTTEIGLGEIISLQAKKIDINRQNGMASGLVIEFDNKNGILSPDGTENPKLLWPNKKIKIEQGYGNEIIQTYKGLIDTVEMSTFPQSITISARDNLKRALDQTVSTILGEHVLTFVGMQVEDMFTSLASMAGIQLGVVEETGIAVEEKTFSWESYGDAFSWLCELVGFEVICDEEGITHFRKQQIPTTPDISYEFTEGEDIVSLGYTINDSDLYRDIIVHGKTTVLVDEKEVDEVIEFKKVFSAADYWGLLPQKILKIDAPEASSLAECEAIALKAEYLMISRARIVRFQSIGIPHLQVGDYIQVNESSTTISEVYRITDLSTNQDSDTYTMDITCHWYSAGGVE